MIKRIAAIVLLSLSLSGVQGQSLWTPGFSGYLSGSSTLKVGDTVLVTIDANTKLSYTASNVSDKSLTLQFGGGDTGNLFSFLPAGSTGSKQNLKGDEQLALTGSLVTRVQSIDANGTIFVQGSRSSTINGREQSISLSGWVDPRLLKDSRTIPFSQVADARLDYRSVLEPSAPVLTSNDLVQVIQSIATQNAAAVGPQGAGAPPAAASPAGSAPAAAGPAPAQPAAPGAQPPAAAQAGYQGQTPVAAGQPPPPSVTLTDQKKRELLLQYLNQLLDLVFQPTAPAPQPKQ